jgi:hypothetical protein
MQVRSAVCDRAFQDIVDFPEPFLLLWTPLTFLADGPLYLTYCLLFERWP